MPRVERSLPRGRAPVAVLYPQRARDASDDEEENNSEVKQGWW